jgi:hypothetical protein
MSMPYALRNEVTKGFYASADFPPDIQPASLIGRCHLLRDFAVKAELGFLMH